MAALVKITTGLIGGKPTLAAAAAGQTFVNTGRTLLQVKNASASAITVTIPSKEKCNMGFTHDVTVSIPATEERIIGPFNTTRFGTSIALAYSAIASVTVGAFET